MDLNDVAWVIGGKLKVESIGEDVTAFRASLLGPDGRPAKVPAPMNPERLMDTVAASQGENALPKSKRRLADLIRAQRLSYGLAPGLLLMIHVPPDIKEG